MFHNFLNSSMHSMGKELFTFSASFNLLMFLLAQDHQLGRGAFRNVPLTSKLIVTFKGCK